MSYELWKRRLVGQRLPAAVVDLDALDANIATLIDALGDTQTTIRVASKSIRHPWILRHILERGEDKIRGMMTFSADETAFLADQGFDDFLTGYPIGSAREAETLAGLAHRGVNVIATIDDPTHVSLLNEAAANAKTVLSVCVDTDAAWRPFGGRMHVGVRRSPVRDDEAACRLAKLVAATDHLDLTAVLAYEAQVAGLQDVNRHSRKLDPIRALIKSRSRPFVARKRETVCAALKKAGHHISLVNGGGTGSIRSTAFDPSVTEVTVGSGFLCPHLFDGYRDLELLPAVFFAIGVVRKPEKDHVTAMGGGYPASGPAEPDRLPVVAFPQGLRPLSMEGWGEVQTPFKLPRRNPPAIDIGSPIICRHAKAGELAERFDTYLLARGEEIVGCEPTYRGLGGCFL